MTTTVWILSISRGAPWARASPAARPERPAASMATADSEFFIEHCSERFMSAPQVKEQDLAEITARQNVGVPWQFREKLDRYPRCQKNVMKAPHLSIAH